MNSHRRAAFTLLEVLLTLVVLTAVAAVAIPQLGGLLADRKLDRAADQLRIEMTRARVESMRKGRVLMMEMGAETGQFRIRPYSSLSDATESDQVMSGTSALLNGADQANFAAPMAETIATQNFELPENVVFGAVSVASSTRSTQISQEAAVVPVSGTEEVQDQVLEYSTPILFYPDGTTSTAVAEVLHEGVGSLMVRLRGITGDVTISPGATGAP
ncbi:MAG: prepilin-type N-terminal cleavage/methylation domain-containing protein [Planctomycetota bacterium]